MGLTAVRGLIAPLVCELYNARGAAVVFDGRGGTWHEYVELPVHRKVRPEQDAPPSCDGLLSTCAKLGFLYGNRPYRRAARRPGRRRERDRHYTTYVRHVDSLSVTPHDTHRAHRTRSDPDREPIPKWKSEATVTV